LTLEKLALSFEGNLYGARPWQGLFNWGVDWKRHKTYGTLDEVKSELKLERGGRAEELNIEGFPSRDFRVPADSPMLKTGCYPKGEVPGVRLGTR
jgi:hypothetical protein